MSLSSLPVSYCTNVHAGRTVAEVDAGLDEYTVAVRDACGQPLAAGLWLARSVATELLASPDTLTAFRDRLAERQLPCYTLNTFPYGDFHSERVKENVYLPDWTTDARRIYTIDCAQILASLLPDGTEGSLSTLPLGGRMNPRGERFLEDSISQIIQTARELQQLYEQTGKRIRLAIEPEPCCEMSSVPADVIPVFTRLREHAAELGAPDVVNDFVGLCFDVCHQAVEFEDVAESIELLEAHSIRINKVHISSAIELLDPATNRAGREALAGYVEPRYLHQTYALCGDGRVLNRVDLNRDDVLRDPDSYSEFDQASAWRVHFHVPVNAEQLGPLGTTRKDLRRALSAVQQLDYAPHLEIETYTWEVLPDGQSVDLVTGLSQEVTATGELLHSLSDPDAPENAAANAGERT